MSAPYGGPDHHPVDELPAMVAGELSPELDQQVAGHLAGCDACRQELAVVVHMSSWLRDAAKLTFAEPVELPPLDRSGPRHGPLPPASHPVRPARNHRRSRWIAAAAAAAIVVGAGTTVAITHRDGAPGVVVSLSAVPGGTGTGSSGQAAMKGSGAEQTMTVHARGLQKPPGQAYYEVWLLNTATNAMVSVGVLPDTGRGEYSLPASRAAGYNAVDVSLEPDDNNPAHSDDSVLRGLIA